MITVNGSTYLALSWELELIEPARRPPVTDDTSEKTSEPLQ